ncbi:hypothetical protein [Oricola thermophila]|uniref:Uncharacterized protein n=1 Tax=Oricola thermophila TaxID=2742145 RepID=A0A6N1VEN2_9HYPH|nr:hypothetical protein [Oricola thermophila]QKV17692.1 hypothetical protein HTY61_04010 [Oricola thermophila]
MQFDWALAIRRNRGNILRVLRELFALVGLAFDTRSTGSRTQPAIPGPDATLPRHLCNRVRRVLRSAEAAVRRLVVVAARDIEVQVRHAPARAVKAPQSVSSSPGTPRAPVSPVSPARDERETGIAGPVTVTIRPQPPRPPERPKPSRTGSVRVPVNLGLANIRYLPEPERQECPARQAIPAFPLIDPLKRFDCFRPRRRHARTRPRIRLLGDNPLPVYMRHPPVPEPELPMPDDPVPAGRLLRRLLSVKRALDDLDREARRLARWRVRQHHGLCRAKRFSPMRPGLPPGWRRRNRYDIDEILKECHRIAFWAENGDP